MEDIIYGIYQKVKERFQEFYEETEGIFPIPIEKMAETLGLSVTTKNLNFANSRKYNQRIGELNDKSIIIDENVDYYAGRFAVAHEIGHFLLNEDRKEEDKGVKIAQYSLPLLSSEKDEILADVYAIFLLIPLDLFFEEFRDYLENIEVYPIDITNWWRTLSEKAEIPFHSVASGYNYIKMAALKYYQDNVVGKSIEEQYAHYGDLFF